MKITLTTLLLLGFALHSVSCTSSEERDGRKYYGGNTPVMGKTGVQYKRVKADNFTPTASASPDDSLLGSLGLGRASESEPPGLMDRNEKPDEPGAKYWLHGQQSASPVQGKMGVRVNRVKKGA